MSLMLSLPSILPSYGYGIDDQGGESLSRVCGDRFVQSPCAVNASNGCDQAYYAGLIISMPHHKQASVSVTTAGLIISRFDTKRQV